MGHSTPPVVTLTRCPGFQSQVRSQQDACSLSGNRAEKCTGLEVKIFQISLSYMTDGTWSWGWRCIHPVLKDRRQILRVLRAWNKNESFPYFPEHSLPDCRQVADLSFLDFRFLICKVAQIMFCFQAVKIEWGSAHQCTLVRIKPLSVPKAWISAFEKEERHS
jgi:hypothetical protein